MSLRIPYFFGCKGQSNENTEAPAQTRLEPPAPIRCAQFPQNAILTLTVIAEKRG